MASVKTSRRTVLIAALFAAEASVFACVTPSPISRKIDRSAPERIEVYGPKDSWLATFTHGAVTVSSHGPIRTFSEPSAAAAVTHDVWVRTLDQPFAGKVDEEWLKAALEANRQRKDDILAIGMQYIAGAAPLYDKSGLRIAGAAFYGPLNESGERSEGSDVNDYLGFRALSASRQPERERARSLDCSGFIRMIWAYRNELARPPIEPFRAETGTISRQIPRTAAAIFAAELGVVVIPDRGSPPQDLRALNVGDTLYFNAAEDRAEKIDHVALYLGLDAQQQHRFLSSRKSSDGPTMGDLHGASILEGDGHFARGFRAAKRF